MPVNMTAAPHRTPTPPAAATNLDGEAEIRRGLELLYFGNAHVTRAIDRGLAGMGLGRAHHRALYWTARHPDVTVSELLGILSITKQSLGRVLGELGGRGLVETRPGARDRRQRLLRLTADGAKLEAELFGALRQRMAAGYAVGEDAVAGFWAVLEALIPQDERARIEAIRG